MPQNDSQQEPTKEMLGPTDKTAVTAAVTSEDFKAAAAAEEQQLADKLAASKAEQDAAEGKEHEPLQLAAVASEGRDRLLAELRKHATKPKAEYVPPPPTARQMSQTEMEMEAGRRATARHAERNPTPPNPNLTPSPSTPVHRPGTHVPGLNSRDPAVL